MIGTASLDRLPRRMRHRGELGISVLKAYQNRGIGRRLITEILSYARDNEFSVIDLQVRCDNSAAVHLYETMGFEICGVHPAFFQIGEETVPFYMMYRNIL
jgi:ribosomal protein S18 acetylase RimI-like enzyme